MTLALEYAQIDYEKIWDDDVLQGALDDYDWLHLHHEDFTGQYGKSTARTAIRLGTANNKSRTSRWAPPRLRQGLRAKEGP